MTNYSTKETDYITQIKSGDNSAFEQLSIQYLSLIRSISTEYKAEGFDTNDFVQEGLLGLWNAVKSFDSTKGISFKNYAMKCIKNRFVSIVRKSRQRGTVPKDMTVSIDDVEITDNNLSPETLILFRESLASFYDSLQNKLSSRERAVMQKYIQGYSYEEISNNLGIDKKSVDNALSRAKHKLAIK